MKGRWLIFVAVLAVAIPAASADEIPATSCTLCHGDADLFDEDHLAIVEGVADDVHATVGLSCHDCHGGNPSVELADDPAAAMDESDAANPYVGVPERPAIAAFCGRCHSDPSYMKRFKPDARVDQEQEYRTSHHGQALARGDTAAATCVDCHGVHGVRATSDPESPVYPTRVAETCSTCHSDPETMGGRSLANGRPLPIDQFNRWQRSVHAVAMFDKGDLTAPTCNDCHGNHGATPPGLDSVAFVCGQCHGREAELFRDSPKQAGFHLHNEYLADAGETGCATCHEEPEPQAAVRTVHSFTECTTCHGNHAIIRPTVGMLSPLPEVPCAFCHEGTGPLADTVAEPPSVVANYEEKRDELLATAAEQGLEGAELFDWMVEQALMLTTHTEIQSGEEGEVVALRPEFDELFHKFRIGKTTFTYADPVTGEEVQASVVRCSECHGPETLMGEPVGHTTAEAFVQHSRELMVLTARAERMLLRARRGGVETREALEELEQAVDAGIELEVLVHSFTAEEDSAFVAKSAEGREHAAAALAQSQEALGELAYRRRGLAISLIIIVLVLIGLALRIRQLPPTEAAPTEH